MKRNQKPLLASLALGTALILSATSGAQAAVTITIAPSGADVVATGGGTINLSALLFRFNSSIASSNITIEDGLVRIGAASSTSLYSGITGPSSIGSGVGARASSATGAMFGVFVSAGSIQVPQGYVSNALLSGTATWNGKTISSLGLTPGTYVYNWGSGGTADSLTLQIVPEPSHALLLLGGLGTLALRRRR